MRTPASCTHMRNFDLLACHQVLEACLRLAVYHANRYAPHYRLRSQMILVSTTSVRENGCWSARKATLAKRTYLCLVLIQRLLSARLHCVAKTGGHLPCIHVATPDHCFLRL